VEIDEKVRFACDAIAEMLMEAVPDDYEWIVAVSAPHGSAVMVSNMPPDGVARALSILLARAKENPAADKVVLVTAGVN